MIRSRSTGALSKQDIVRILAEEEHDDDICSVHAEQVIQEENHHLKCSLWPKMVEQFNKRKEKKKKKRKTRQRQQVKWICLIGNVIKWHNSIGDDVDDVRFKSFDWSVTNISRLSVKDQMWPIIRSLSFGVRQSKKKKNNKKKLYLNLKPSIFIRFSLNTWVTSCQKSSGWAVDGRWFGRLSVQIRKTKEEQQSAREVTIRGKKKRRNVKPMKSKRRVTTKWSKSRWTQRNVWRWSTDLETKSAAATIWMLATEVVNAAKQEKREKFKRSGILPRRINRNKWQTIEKEWTDVHVYMQTSLTNDRCYANDGKFKLEIETNEK